MRRILVAYARRRRFLKRGGAMRRVSLDQALDVSNERGADLVALDDALTTLTAMDSRQGQVVELRFFGGLSVEETAEVLKVSRGDRHARLEGRQLWLLSQLSK